MARHYPVIRLNPPLSLQIARNQPRYRAKSEQTVTRLRYQCRWTQNRHTTKHQVLPIQTNFLLNTKLQALAPVITQTITNSHIQLINKRLIDPSDDHIPFKLPASKKTSEKLFITVQSSLMRNFLVSCNPLRDTHLITNDLMEDTELITNNLLIQTTTTSKLF